MNKKQLSQVEIQGIVSQLESYLSDLKSRWDTEKPKTSWFSISKGYLFSGTKFILSCLDELILFVEDLIPAGTDKKQAVMVMVNRLFDYIVVQAFPFWLKPFVVPIKEIVVNILVDNLIDYIVNKYNSGYWKMKEGTNEKEESN